MATQSEREGHFGDPKAGLTIYVSIVGVLIFVLTIIYLETLYYVSDEQQRLEKEVNIDHRELARIRAEQEEWLTEYKYDHAYNSYEGRFTIPIDEAAQKLLAEWPEPRFGPNTPPAEEAAEGGGPE